MARKPRLSGSAPEIREAATAGRRSTLYRWMLENFAEFSATVKEAGRPNWVELARVFGEKGLRDLSGRPPTAEGTRQTWWKVRQATAKADTTSTPAPSRAVAPPQQGAAHERRDAPSRPRFEFSPKADEDRLLGDTKPRK